MSAQIVTNSRRGVALGFAGGLVISFDVPLIRLAEADPWTTMVVRGLCLFLVFLPLVAIATRRAKAARQRYFTRDWIEVGLLYGVSNVFFTLSVFHTTTANLVFILAFNTMMAALIGWWLIGERPSRATWAAIAATIAGVAIIVGGNIGSGSVGDFYALACAASLAITLVRARQSGRDMSLTPAIGGLFAAAAGLLPMLAVSAAPPQAPQWLLVNALLVVPISAWCLALAPRYIPAPQVAMFYLIETVLAPVWVWLVFAEEITVATFIGGAIILSALLAHSAWSIARNGAARRAQREGLQPTATG